LKDKLNRAIQAAEEQVAVYESIIDDAVENMAQNKVRITMMAGNSLIELRQVIRAQKMVTAGNSKLAEVLQDETSPINEWNSIIERGEEMMLQMTSMIRDFEKKSNLLKSQMVNFTKKYKEMEALFKIAGYDLKSIDEGFGLRKPGLVDSVVSRIGKTKDSVNELPFPDIPESDRGGDNDV